MRFYCLILAGASLFFTARAERAWSNHEAGLKAAMLYNFARFVQFPVSDSSTLNVCVVGPNSFRGAIYSIAGKSVRGKKVVTSVLSDSKGLKDCQIAYFSKELGEQTYQYLGYIEGDSILTVSEQNDFTKRGGMIQLVKAGSMIKFRVNLDIARAHNLNISARLLAIAFVE